jgi:GSCFA family
LPNPYRTLPPNALWGKAIANKAPLEISDLWKPKHPLRRSHKVATFGSHFAEHFGRALKQRGYAWFDAEPAPDIFVPAIQKKYKYGIFSARTGFIDTVAALRQWVSWAIGIATPPEEIWEAQGRFFDPFRPSIEPDGFATAEELLASRGMVLRAIRNIIEHADWLVFTLGLTEGWISRSKGYNYAKCPGTIAGEFDGNDYAFKNYTFAEISSDLGWVIEAICSLNNKMHFILTVSPIPLAATASGKHVLTATTFSKSLLRAVAGTMADNLESVDYFPAYEIITGPPFKGMFYEPNKLSVSKLGTTFVMDSFFACIEQKTFADMPAAIEVAANTESNPREFWRNVLSVRNALRSPSGSTEEVDARAL